MRHRRELPHVVELLAAVESAGDLEGLPLRACGRRVRGELAGGDDERERGPVRPREELVLPDRGLDALDRVEVAVLAARARPSAATSFSGFPPPSRNDIASRAASSTCCWRSSMSGSPASSWSGSSVASGTGSRVAGTLRNRSR